MPWNIISSLDFHPFKTIKIIVRLLIVQKQAAEWIWLLGQSFPTPPLRNSDMSCVLIYTTLQKSHDVKKAIIVFLAGWNYG